VKMLLRDFIEGKTLQTAREGTIGLTDYRQSV
jgi:hypothetical protein